jgi:tRNA-uridine 2-sulfurtransferase
VRDYAHSRGLTNASKPDSTDLCFVEGDDYGGWVEQRVGTDKIRSGPIETIDGKQVGRHDGIHRFTVGQRRGVGAIGGSPKYVLKILPERDAVIVGDAEQAMVERALVREVRWLDEIPTDEIVARIRYRHPGVRAVVQPRSSGEVELILREPQRGVAPGQAAVLYKGERVVGGGFIA